MKTSRTISIQDPAGIWTPMQLIGATVKIRSTSVASGLFCFDANSTYTIASIGFRMNRQGKAYSVVTLEGERGEFTWKDLEITGVSFYLYPKAICGEFCSGMTLCGYQIETESTLEDGDNLSNREPPTYIEDGELLD